MRLSSLTALDIAGVRPRRQPDGAYSHACVACGSAARTGGWHTQCSDPSCNYQVLSPLDTLAARFNGNYERAAAFVNDELRRTAVTPEMVLSEMNRRRVLDFWLHHCLKQPTTLQGASQVSALREKGWYLLPSQKNMTVLTGPTIVKLIEMAMATGAEFPDALLSQHGSSAAAFVVQSIPHTIDRIVITTGRGSEWPVVWHRKRVGITGLIGMEPEHLLAADYRTALTLQRRLHDLGHTREVSALYVSRKDPATRETWRPDINKMRTVVAGTEDIVTMSAFYDSFPLTTDTVPSVHLRRLVAVSDVEAVSWSWMRRSYLAAAIDGSKREISDTAIRLLEKAHPSREEISWLIQRYREQGRLELAEDIKRHMDNRVIFDDGKLSIRETASDYVIDYGGSTSSISNFAIQFTHNLFFRDSVDVFHAGRLTYGRTSMEIAVSSHAVDNLNELQKTVRHQMLVRHANSAPEHLPTIIDAGNMRRYVLPYFRRQVSSLPSREGFCNLGWTADRAMFVGPGIKVTMNGRESGAIACHPNVAQLKHFVNDISWDVGFSADLPTPARDLVSMILASCARFFVKGVTKPVCVQHSPAARHLLTTMFAAIGQREIFELNPNLRDLSSTHGLRGYPFLTTGYNAAQSMGAKFGHVLLTDTGYCVNDEVSQELAEAAGRSLQFGLLRLVEWCLATGGSEFSEVPALHYNSSLLREGKWLVENVCELQPWEVSDLGLIHLENLLAQIPVDDVPRRMKIKDGTTLTASLHGLDWDRDAVRGDLQILRTVCEGEGDDLVMGAVEVLPALETYYGRRPEVSVVF